MMSIKVGLATCALLLAFKAVPAHAQCAISDVQAMAHRYGIPVPPDERLLSIKVQSKPAVGEAAQVEVGETMVSAYRINTVRLYKTAAPYKAKGLTVPAGPVSCVRQNSKGQFWAAPGFLPHVTYGISQPDTTGGVFIPTDQSRPTSIYWDGLFGAVTYEVPGIVIRETVEERPGDNSFKRELVYTGTSKGTITLLYREFKNDMARPAFSQELNYDLSSGDEIGYKGARFKIQSATNTSIKYVVLRGLD